MELLKDDCKIKKKEWTSFEDDQTKLCKRKEEIGRKLYNYALIAMFLGLLFAIIPYNLLIAVVASGLGLAFEASQVFRKGETKSADVVFKSS